MKKFLATSLVLITVLGVLLFTVSTFALELNDKNKVTNANSVEGDDGSGETVVTWLRKDDPCNDPKNPGREKTSCSLGGNEQCTAQYCN